MEEEADKWIRCPYCGSTNVYWYADYEVGFGMAVHCQDCHAHNNTLEAYARREHHRRKERKEDAKRLREELGLPPDASAEEVRAHKKDQWTKNMEAYANGGGDA